MNRAIIAPLFAACLCAGAPACAQSTGAPKLAAVMDFELVNEMRDFETDESRTAQQRRLDLIGDELRKEFDRRGLYRIADNAGAAKLIADQSARQELRNCNGCELDIGRALGADVIILGWVQKVSNLILNVNIEVKDVATGRVLYTKSVDLRGNTEKSWLRGIHYMVDDIVEKKLYLR